MRRSFLFGAAAMLALAGAAQADILWNQLPDYDNMTASGLPDRITVDPFSGPSAIFAVSDVTVPTGGWTIQSVSTYFTDFSFEPTVTSAVLNIFPKTGNLPLSTNDPRTSPTGQGTTVAVVDVRTIGGATQQPAMILTAAGLNINLAAGSYWIGLTPTLAGGFFGTDSHWPAVSLIGDQSAARGYGSGPGATFPWTGAGAVVGVPAFDLAMTVTGVPAPSSLALLGLAGLATARRRR